MRTLRGIMSGSRRRLSWSRLARGTVIVGKKMSIKYKVRPCWFARARTHLIAVPAIRHPSLFNVPLICSCTSTSPTSSSSTSNPARRTEWPQAYALTASSLAQSYAPCISTQCSERTSANKRRVSGTQAAVRSSAHDKGPLEKSCGKDLQEGRLREMHRIPSTETAMRRCFCFIPDCCRFCK